MLRIPASRSTVSRDIRSASIPAPVGGWNARDSWADMPQEDAVILDNIFPDTDSCAHRKGYTEHVTGILGTVETLMAWNGPTSSKLKAAAGTAIYDVTNAGSVGSAEVTSLTNARWQHINFTTSAGQFLVCCNGADAVRNFNGTSWTTPTISGATSADLIHVESHNRRLWFIEKESSSAWFLPVDAISGTATKLDLGAEFRLGGYLQSMAVWTRDAGDGLDDLLCFISSLGEVSVYQGTDPSSASTWTKIGTFRIAPPIGRRCAIRMGSDVFVMTQDGMVALSGALPAGRTTQNVIVSNKIRSAYSSAAKSYGSNFGWQPLFYPRGHYAFVNVPLSSTQAHQYVVNTTTGAWCRFTGQNAFCWELLNERLYFGGVSTVFLADNGLDDNGSNIPGEAKQAYGYFGTRRQKRFTNIRPIFHTEGAIEWAMRVSVDFDVDRPEDISTFTPALTTPWGSAWGSAWGSSSQMFRDYRAVTGIGYAGAFHAKISIKGVTCKWFATDWLFEPGGYL
jgi:hypothetical protein